MTEPQRQSCWWTPSSGRLPRRRPRLRRNQNLKTPFLVLRQFKFTCWNYIYENSCICNQLSPASLSKNLGFAADYQRSLSVPISIHVEDADSYSDSIDLSCSLDFRRPQSACLGIEVSENPPSTSSFLLWVRLLLNRRYKPSNLCISHCCTGSYISGKPQWGFSQTVCWGCILCRH